MNTKTYIFRSCKVKSETFNIEIRYKSKLLKRLFLQYIKDYISMQQAWQKLTLVWILFTWVWAQEWCWLSHNNSTYLDEFNFLICINSSRIPRRIHNPFSQFHSLCWISYIPAIPVYCVRTLCFYYNFSLCFKFYSNISPTLKLLLVKTRWRLLVRVNLSHKIAITLYLLLIYT